MTNDRDISSVLVGQILEDEEGLSLAELCRACDVHAEWVTELVSEGVLEPSGTTMAQWRFAALSIRRVHVVLRLQRDLGVNISGAALALELMDEIRALRARLDAFENE